MLRSSTEVIRPQVPAKQHSAKSSAGMGGESRFKWAVGGLRDDTTEDGEEKEREDDRAKSEAHK